jgi:copper chaperone NosL
MTIVDKIHGAEIVTDKGKVFKFDAAECLIRYHHDLESTDGYMLLTNHFEMPEALMPMEEATFLISEDLPSPMGAFLTAFKTDTKASELKEEKGGNLYNWEDLKKQINQ